MIVTQKTEQLTLFTEKLLIKEFSISLTNFYMFV